MSVSNERLQELFVRESELDIDKLVCEATSGLLTGFTGYTAAVSDTAIMYAELGLNRRLTPEYVLILRKALREHLKISKAHSRMWVHPDPDPTELAESWHLQVESMKAWDYFTSAFNRLKDIKIAYALAFESQPLQPLRFRDDEARLAFETMLKNEQQEFIGGKAVVPVRVLKEDTLVSELEPTHVRLLELLRDGQPKTVKALLYDLYGLKALSQENRQKLHRRISELNKKLAAHWGAPSSKRWVLKVPDLGEPAYRLAK